MSEARAERERKRADDSAGADGKPAAAMREDASGAESPAGKVGGGKAPGKPSAAIAGARETVSPSRREESAGRIDTDPSRPQDRSSSEKAPSGSPSEGDPDNLQRISGIGPALERLLNEAGITRYAQLAALDSEGIEQLEARLNFKGRVSRDEWQKQAAALAKGEDEYVRVFGKKPR